MSYDKHILEGMDALRSNDDLESVELGELRERLETDPDTRRLLERSARLDASIRVAMHDVPVPSDLKQRLLDQLGEQSAAERATVLPIPVEDKTALEVRGSEGPPRRSLAPAASAGSDGTGGVDSRASRLLEPATVW